MPDAVRVELKPGVPDVPGSPAIQRARATYAAVHGRHWPQPAVTVTSTSDGKHMAGSRHYDRPHNAEDFRLPEPLRRWLAELRTALGADYDVILEPDHVHVEYDPKGGR